MQGNRKGEAKRAGEETRLIERGRKLPLFSAKRRTTLRSRTTLTLVLLTLVLLMYGAEIGAKNFF